MTRRPKQTPASAPCEGREEELDPAIALSPYKAAVWRELSPRERLRYSWRLRSRLVDPRAVHDRKLFPAP